MTLFPKSLLGFCLGFFLLIGCTPNPQETSETSTANTQQTLDITVSILPQQYFVNKIAGDLAQVNVMVEPGSEPEIYEPKPQQLRQLATAEGYITIGVPFEKGWMEKIKSANSDMLIIDSAKGIEKMEMIDHHHQGESENETENYDTHIWLSPQLVKIQAENIYQGLVELDPANQEIYQANLVKFLQEIDQLDQEIRVNLEGIKNRKFIVFHPAWGYFAKEYNLEQIPIEVGGQKPSAAELAKVVTDAKNENIRVIFAQYQFNSQDAETIAKEIGGKVILIDPLDPNWSENLRKVSQTFAETLK
jgi:zinc transport system substrate-binding protein